MQKYRLISKKGQGTFSQVLKAQSIKTGKFVAIKCMKNHFDSFEQVTNLREIQALKRLSPHPHIIRLLQVLYDQPTGRLALVFELMDMNMYEAIKGRRHYIPETRVKNYIYQLLKSIDHMHRNGIFHRDIKPQNLLIMEDCLKLADFGSCRGIFSHQPFTEYISTRWYRPPECLLTNGYYNYKMDMWGVGCVFFEVLSLFALFPGNNQVDQVKKIHNILGIPPQRVLDKLKNYPGQMQMDFQPQQGTGIQKLINHIKTPQCLDIIKKLLTYDADERMTARQALAHPYFKDLREKDKRQPKYPLYPPPVGLSYAKDQTAPSDNGSDGSFKMAKRSSQAAAAAAASKIGGLKDIHLPQQAGSKPRLSIGTSDEQSETDGRSLPPIKQYPGKIMKKPKGKQSGYNYKTNEYHYPIQMLKHNLSNQSLSKKSQSINQDLKIDKAKFFKKTFMEPQGYHGSGQGQSGSGQPHRGYTKKKKPIYMI